MTELPSDAPADIRSWRKAERARLIGAREALDPQQRAADTTAIARDLDALLAADALVSVYWPIRAEPDLRAWMRARCERGGRVALPVAIALREPMQFRAWQPGAPMARGLWQIPIPAAGEEVVPDAVIAPLVGYDPQCFRLGYGGGFFDRTLAGLIARGTRPQVIGVGFTSQALASIHPQPHDIPMDWILTGSRPPQRRAAG
ncbi:MAG: 5-formyltetrahydrofolate cyclo-ligase [Gammaproteobacteria bacterium]|nr:5-formyltetrahydrofolate cyclo-ligase [Gammaproteobacteria bacterium]